MMRTHQVELMRPAEIAQAIAEAPVAYLPAGPLEWHGPHCNVGTDPLNAQYLAHEAVKITGGLVFPTLYLGTERERSAYDLNNLGFPQEQWVVGMDFPANSLPSLYASEEIFALTLREYLRLIPRWNARLVVVVNGHGATNQLNTIERLVNEYNQFNQARYLHFFPYVSGQDGGETLVGHAAKLETSLMMAIYPQAVDLAELPAKPAPMYYRDWAIVDWFAFIGKPTPDRTISPQDDPRDASVEYGRSYLEKMVQLLSQTVLEALRNL